MRRTKRFLPVLAVLLVLPGCGTLGDAAAQLTPQGRYDVARDTAVTVVEQLSTQVKLVVSDRDAGVISDDEAGDQYRALRGAQRALERTIRVADALSAEDPSAALLDLEAATETARIELRRRLR